MRVLIACEQSGIVREAFCRHGHDAWSCDLVPSERPGQHLQGDAMDYLAHGWDLLIASPPCTYLARAGARWWAARQAEQKDALDFIRALLNAPIPRIALENPPGRIGTAIRPADQYIQPWQFGHREGKLTGLWLKNLPRLQATCVVDPARYRCPTCKQVWTADYGMYCRTCLTLRPALPVWDNQTPSGQNRLGPSQDRARLRSQTYQGIADAMAGQYGIHIV